MEEGDGNQERIKGREGNVKGVITSAYPSHVCHVTSSVLTLAHCPFLLFHLPTTPTSPSCFVGGLAFLLQVFESLQATERAEFDVNQDRLTELDRARIEKKQGRPATEGESRQ